jgi:hypothetical protein
MQWFTDVVSHFLGSRERNKKLVEERGGTNSKKGF